MKRTLVPVIFVLLLASCSGFFSDPPKQSESQNLARLTVNLTTASRALERTIVADFSASIMNYEVTLSGGPGGPVSLTGSAGSHSFNVTPGSWNIDVVAKNTGGEVVASGGLPGISLTTGQSRTVTVPLSFSQTGTGDLSLILGVPVTMPSGELEISSVIATAYLSGITNQGSTLPLGFVAEGVWKTAVISFSGLPSGNYEIELVFNDSLGGNAGVYREAATVWDNVTSDRWINPISGELQSERLFAASEFYKTNTSLSSIRIPPATLGFSSETRVYTGIHLINGNAVDLTIVQSIPGQVISLDWTGDGTAPLISASFKSGSTLTLFLGEGSNQLDINVTAPNRTTAAIYSIELVKAWTVTYDANGGAGTVPASTSHPSTLPFITAVQGNLSWPGYVFTGWNDVTDGSGTAYAAGAESSGNMPAANIILYAQWEAKPEMAQVLGGTYYMNHTDIPGSTYYGRTVVLSDFQIGKYEVTFAQFDLFCADPASPRVMPTAYYGRGEQPVINVSWYDAVEYCNWLSLKDGLTPAYAISNRLPGFAEPPSPSGSATSADVTINLQANGYRLPTEAEWEWAARGRNPDFNTALASGASSASDWSIYSWTFWNSSNATHLIGSRQPNALGLYDMSGNVSEFCSDSYLATPTYPAIEANPLTLTGTDCINRGGSWSDSYYGAVAFRNYAIPIAQTTTTGFRVARTYPSISDSIAVVVFPSAPVFSIIGPANFWSNAQVTYAASGPAFDEYLWYINGVLKFSATAVHSFTLMPPLADLYIGKNRIMLVVRRGASYYSEELSVNMFAVIGS